MNNYLGILIFFLVVLCSCQIETKQKNSKNSIVRVNVNWENTVVIFDENVNFNFDSQNIIIGCELVAICDSIILLDYNNPKKFIQLKFDMDSLIEIESTMIGIHSENREVIDLDNNLIRLKNGDRLKMCISLKIIGITPVNYKELSDFVLGHDMLFVIPNHQGSMNRRSSKIDYCLSYFEAEKEGLIDCLGPAPN